MKTTTAANRPYPRAMNTEAGGFSPQPVVKPQLTSRWVVGQDGKLTCHWGRL